MDARRFDTLTRAPTDAGTRRGVISALAALPVLGGLFALFDGDEAADAKGRRKRRKKRHKHGKGRDKGKHKKRPCRPHAKTKTCSGRCGPVKNNCKKTVDCGSCDCREPCGDCLIYQSGPNTPGSCVLDPEQDGDDCDDGDACTSGTTCTDGVCGGGSPVSCPATECQVAGACDPETGCAAPTNAPAGTTCASQPCGACNGAGVCVADAACGSGELCCSGVCESGVCCVAADCTSEGAPDCVDHDCVCPANSDQPCLTDQTCCTTGCFDLETDPDHCGSCTDACAAGEDCCAGACFDLQTNHDHCGACDNACEADEICVDGVCETCNVTNGQNLATKVAAAQDGDTLYVCPGTYAGTITISTNLTLIGAGEGTDGTVIQGGNPVVRIQVGTMDQPVTLQRLRIQNGFQGILNSGICMLTSCTIANNSSVVQGGGLKNEGIATLTDCLFEGNGGYQGGGIWSGSHQTTLIRTRVTGNSATIAGGGFVGSGVLNNGGTVTLQDHSIVCANDPTANQCFHVSADGTSGCPAECPAE